MTIILKNELAFEKYTMVVKNYILVTKFKFFFSKNLKGIFLSNTPERHFLGHQSLVHYYFPNAL